jgi:hypothetical protein
MVVVGARHQSLTGAGPSVEVVLGPGHRLLMVVLGPRGCRWWSLPPLVDGGRGCSSPLLTVVVGTHHRSLTVVLGPRC